MLLAAIIDGGVYIPVDGQGSVIFVGVDDSGPVLPGYVSDTCLRQWLPSSADAVLCDALRLIDIAEHTGVHTLAVFSTEQWAKVPLGLVARTLRDRGMRTQGEQTVELIWSTHPLALALRQAFAERILSFPAVRTVWLAHARWGGSDSEQLMVHMDVDASAPEAANALLDAVLSNDVKLRPGDPLVALRVFQPEETDAIREIDRLGLDTVRAHHALSQVEIISRQFD
ncbi:hypothetical protein [Micromonospora polyrhachis]|uniref:Uncharacterized protein n=1 Tax=Micromonospora polyrhachis TaxID=1282883 RepID=A0A7W7WMC6_9ACTN|nr:hypothetical protein [Micromonospora polyrhachis]MBB4956299.1 hypothetical protein [Micromonospora polyrhachis]